MEYVMFMIFLCRWIVIHEEGFLLEFETVWIVFVNKLSIFIIKGLYFYFQAKYVNDVCPLMNVYKQAARDGSQ